MNNINEFLEFVESQKRFHKKTGLDMMNKFCEILGNPERKFKSIHVTGTNGKGSVVAYLRDMLMSQGLNVATFTSPYITRFNERICINNIQIPDEEVLKYANIILAKYDAFKSATNEVPSFFEFITLLAFLYFADSNIDVAVIEVGIGGLLDSTNVIMPLASVITNVGYDHMNVLGDTLEEILLNKLGICKPNKPLIVGLKDKHLIDIAKEVAKKNNSKILTPLLGAFEIKECSILSTEYFSDDYKTVKLKLTGYHQVENSLVAITTFKEVAPLLVDNVDLEKAIHAIENTFWPGRLEVMSKDPLIIIDGGHNTDGVGRIMEFIKNQNIKNKRIIFACSDNKEKEKMIKQIEPYFDEIILTSFTYKRHSSADELSSYCNSPNKKVMLDIDEIIEYVRKNPYELNLFLGSLYFVSEIRPKLLEEK